MKHHSLLFAVLLTLYITGCHQAHRSSAAAIPATRPAAVALSAPTAIPAAEPAVPPAPAYPAELEEYYVGMIPDAEDPRFAYRPGTLLVERRPARLRLSGDETQVGPAFHRGPITTARFADNHPEPTPEELASLVLRTQRLIASLSADNHQLREQLAGGDTDDPPGSVAALPTGAAPTLPPAGARAASSATVPPVGDPADAFPGGLNVIRPNADNVIELDPALFAAPAAPGNNPFVQLYQPIVQLRELSFVVSAAVPGPNPSAIINDAPYGLHSQFQGLEILRIEADTVYLRKDSFLLACPVSDKTLRLRLP